MTDRSTPDHFNARKFLLFVAVGGIATAIHWSIAAVLIMGFSLPAVAASTIGFVCSVAFNLLSNARFTFDQAHVDRYRVLRFLIVASSGCAWNAIVLSAGLDLGLPTLEAQLIATALVLGWNFTLNATWVFRSGGTI